MSVIQKAAIERKARSQGKETAAKVLSKFRIVCKNDLKNVIELGYIIFNMGHFCILIYIE